VNLSIDMARRILEASKQRARELRSPVSIAIVDAGGHLVLFERMMSPYGWATGNISLAKANTAVMFNQSTDAVAQWGSGIPGFASSMSEMSHGKFIMAAGGWPIRIGGATVGGIGVSGGNAPGRDDDIARAGLAALEAMAPPLPAQPAQAPLPPSMSSGSPQGPMQQHSRPYMQPTPSYPSLPPMNNPQQSIAPSNSGIGQQNIYANEQSGQQQSENVPANTQHLPEQAASEEDSPYSDQMYNEQTYNNNRAGGQP
jgi:uncharacterized protein GlcG (DUF336 family)